MFPSRLHFGRLAKKHMQFPDTCDIHIIYLIWEDWEEAVEGKPHHGYGKGVREKRDKERIGKGRDELRKNGWLVPLKQICLMLT